LSELWLNGNQLTSVPAELGKLSSLSKLYLWGNQLTSVPAALGSLRERGVDLDLDDGVTIEV
jgi:leucine-rich repeat protein SHOC2